MDNKPNLYVFVVDTSGSMEKCFEQVNKYVYSFLMNKNYQNDYIAVIKFSESPYLLVSPTQVKNIYVVIKCTENSTKIGKAYQFLQEKK